MCTLNKKESKKQEERLYVYAWNKRIGRRVDRVGKRNKGNDKEGERWRV